MSANIESARHCITRCILFRRQGRAEAALRQEFASWLRRIFPDTDDTAWVNHYSEGAEAVTRIVHGSGATAHRFIDNLIRSTVVEYEANLRQRPRVEHGQQQVREYAAGILRDGVPLVQVQGILSDTVDWHVYDIALAASAVAADCTPDDVTLIPKESLRLETADEATALRFISFLRKHLARQQSRQLTASFITTDLGLDSPAYARHLDVLTRMVDEGRRQDAAARLATDLWSQFVDHLEAHQGEFRTPAYVHEIYIAILARLLSANFLERQALLSDDNGLGDILTGRLFEDRYRLRNMVEQDYFGWLYRSPNLELNLPVAREIQRDLYAYDFSRPAEEDVFGRLMAQLANRTGRKLLGQEWTPQWLARQLAQKSLALLPAKEAPRFIDMCCGSGSIMAELLKAVKSARRLPFADLCEAATGFDIDPLAVLLAKTTWVITLADEIRAGTQPVTIPVFHADSLFAITPVTRHIPRLGQAGDISVDLDGSQVSLPSELISPQYHAVFDAIVDWAYDEARDAQRTHTSRAITEARANEFVDSQVEQCDFTVPALVKERLQSAVFALAKRMADLAVANRNGIWAFILRNTYRPGLLAGQFNGLISNPPWLSMSQIADNPYKMHLTARARDYGIKPGGAAHLHLELATTFLLHALDRYLKPGAVVACLAPGTLLNGQHHAKFRDAAYRTADRPVAFELQEIWDVAAGTFKVRSVALIGIKRHQSDRISRSAPIGAIASDRGIQRAPLRVRRLDKRTAWVIGGSSSIVAVALEPPPPQGADLMPRPAVCVEVVERRGSEWRVRTPRSSDASHFAVKDAKKLQGRNFDGWVALRFIHRMAQSLNLLPFTFDGNFVHIAIPARRDTAGRWSILDAASIRSAGFLQTARRFQRIDRAMSEDRVVKPLHEKIDERHKLTLQVFPRDRFLVLNGAGGGVACAAYLSLAKHPDIVVDQTLYWTVVPTEDEAWYRVGLINSDALTEAVREFNPEGELGPRHLHTLPNRVIPPFDPHNRGQLHIAAQAQRLSVQAQQLLAANAMIADPSRPIAARRRLIRNALKGLPEYARLENACEAILRSAI